MKISLRAARINANLSQRDVAKHMHKNLNTITKWETGKVAIDPIYLKELCSLYNMPAEYISLPSPLD